MQRKVRGFALIEQVALIAALGAASASALPQLVDLRADAESIALSSLAGAASSAMVINYGGCLVTHHAAVPGKCVAISRCEDLGGLLNGGVPEGFRAAAVDLGGGGSRVNGAETRCVLTRLSDGATAPFQGITAGN